MGADKRWGWPFSLRGHNLQGLIGHLYLKNSGKLKGNHSERIDVIGFVGVWVCVYLPSGGSGGTVGKGRQEGRQRRLVE